MNRRDIVLAGHTANHILAREALVSSQPDFRVVALAALERLHELTDRDISTALRDPEPAVRRRAAELAARHPNVGLVVALADSDASVAEMVAWACGEHESPDTVPELCRLAINHPDALVREAAVAALGAIGDPAGLATILAATTDKPAVRRRAFIALTPFNGPEIEAALARAHADKDWQVRMIAADLTAAYAVNSDPS